MNEPTTTRVLLVDDHDLIRDGLAGVFRREPSMDVLGDALCGRAHLARGQEEC